MSGSLMVAENNGLQMGASQHHSCRYVLLPGRWIDLPNSCHYTSIALALVSAGILRWVSYRKAATMEYYLTGSAEHLRFSLRKQGCAVGRYEVSAFADGERRYRLKGDVLGKSVTIVASVLPSPESLFDLLALYRLLQENGAARTDLMVPYLGYARQDRRTHGGEASIGVMVVELLRSIKPSLLFVLDVHSDRIRKALGRSTVELSALPLFAAALAKRPPEVVVAPDAGSIQRARRLAELLKSRPEIATIEKVRPRANVASALRLNGDVRGRDGRRPLLPLASANRTAV